MYLQVLKRVDEVEVICEEAGKQKISSIESIEFRNVSFSYPGQTVMAIKNVSLMFERGKTYSVVGLNGAGKTTLLKLILGLYTPVTGEILLNGLKLDEINMENYYLHIGAIFQDFIKYPFTIEGNVLSDLDNTQDKDIDLALQCAGLKELIKKLPKGIKTKLMREWSGGIELSQGQWQKIAIARCFNRNADLMILDEPFSAIDIESENCIVKNIKQYFQGGINIFITHHFSSISMADEVIVIDNGRVIEQGTHSQLIENKGKYFELYSEQLNTLKNIG